MIVAFYYCIIFITSLYLVTQGVFTCTASYVRFPTTAVSWSIENPFDASHALGKRY